MHWGWCAPQVTRFETVPSGMGSESEVRDSDSVALLIGCGGGAAFRWKFYESEPAEIKSELIVG
jgi:hypothetical protein